ncbi:MAG: hypothetical protein KME59_24190 [Trichormus sp. ATA11-4-KO1]|nr:hypothetical protein [Trichormus sp. ATA11-4-KO1]
MRIAFPPTESDRSQKPGHYDRVFAQCSGNIFPESVVIEVLYKSLYY